MAELIATVFENQDDADHVLNTLQRLQKEHLIDLQDAATVLRTPEGKVTLKQAVNMIGLGAGTGAVSGAFWGTLIGLLFLNPLAGLITGAAVGGGAGALSGALADYGINDEFIKRTGETLKPGTSALFVLVRKAQPEKVLAELKDYHGKIIRSSLSPEQEKKLQDAISRVAAEQPKEATAEAPAS